MAPHPEDETVPTDLMKFGALIAVLRANLCLQMMEDLEQLKVLENGYKIKVLPVLQPACPPTRLPARRELSGQNRREQGVPGVWGLGVLGSTCPRTAPARCSSRAHGPHATHAVQVVVVDHSAHGVDMPEDVASIEAIMRSHGLQ